MRISPRTKKKKKKVNSLMTSIHAESRINVPIITLWKKINQNEEGVHFYSIKN